MRTLVIDDDKDELGITCSEKLAFLKGELSESELCPSCNGLGYVGYARIEEISISVCPLFFDENRQHECPVCNGRGL